MGLVMAAVIAGNHLRKRLVVMMERRQEYYRQDYRQQQVSRYAPFQHPFYK